MGLPWQAALGCVFISGVLFLILTVAGLRQLIVDAIPRALFSAVAAGVGLFIAFIGLRDAGLVVANPATFVGLGNITSPTALLAIAGLILIGALQMRGVRGAMLIGILAVTVVAWAFGLAKITPGDYSITALSGTFLKLDLPAALHVGGGMGGALLEVIFVFLFVDLFDNVGTLVAVTKRAGLVAPDGSIPRLNRILLADSTSAMLGALTGTSTVTSYIESAAGVAAGGRTGLTSVVVGVLFLVTLFFAPMVQVIPTAATAPALILVGCLMLAGVGEIEWSNPLVGLPAFLTLITIPLTFSIANGLAFGIVSYVALQLLSGKGRKQDWLLYVLAALFATRFAYLAQA
jgi:AGZA family xanthine/uracil permease-like MFS transporter